MTAAIQHLYDRLKAHYPHAELELGGIYANKPGYHNKRDNLPPHDYSVQLPQDKLGSGQSASALDITLRDPADLAKLTQRLIDLTYARHPGIQCLREFLGSVNGVDVVGCDVQGVYDITSEDATHTWHEHLSILRQFADDMAAMDALADAIIGTTGGDDVLNDDDKNWIKNMIGEVLRSEGVSGAGDAVHMRNGGYMQMVVDGVGQVVRSEGISGAADASQPWCQEGVRNVVREELDA